MIATLCCGQTLTLLGTYSSRSWKGPTHSSQSDGSTYCFLFSNDYLHNQVQQDNMKLSVHPLCVLYFALGLTHRTQHGANTPWYTKVSSGISENISLPTWLDWAQFLKGLLHSGQPPASSPYSNGGSPASPAGGTEAQVWIKVTL